MRTVFADTFFFLARLNRLDSAHARAVAFSRGEQAIHVATAWVVTEVADALARNRDLFARLHNDVLNNPVFRYIPADEDLLTAGIEYYNFYSDKEWTLTDCISFVVMNNEQIQDALTADHHFEQAGFNALLR
jgi:predicted nucleic acid-binding protein